MEDWYTTECCHDWDDFLQKVKALLALRPSVYFRGHSDYKHRLQSSFDRAFDASQSLEPGHDRWQYEGAILREFMRRAHHYILDTPAKTDLLEWLSLMRHYRAPTRLVDFTYSHYIAAYFAFSDLGCKPRAVWAIDQDWLCRESMSRCRKVLGRTSDKIDLDRPKEFTKSFLDPARKTGPSRSFVAAVTGERMNTRLTIQQGVFLCPGDIQESFETNLRSMVSEKSSPKTIVKFVIPHCSRNKALRELRRMNISMATLFPDLDGLATSLNDHFELLFKDYKVSEQKLIRLLTWTEGNK